MNLLWILVPGVATAVGIGLTSWYLTRRDFHRRFAARPVLRPQEALSSFEAEDVQALAGLWIKLESVLGIEAGKLRLSDRFAEELHANPKFAIYHPEGDVLEDLQECFPNERLYVSNVRDYCEHALRLRRSTPEATDLAKRILG